MLEQLEDSNGDSANEGEGIVGHLPKAISFIPDADNCLGLRTCMTWTRTVKDQERAHCVTLASSIV